MTQLEICLNRVDLFIVQKGLFLNIERKKNIRKKYNKKKTLKCSQQKKKKNELY